MMQTSPTTLRAGLTSVTFRRHSIEEVIARAAEAGLVGIEWGGDVHVPPGDLVNARRVAAQTRGAGLEVASYGSYYRLGVSPPDQGDAVLATAAAMGAGVVRVWAGTTGSAETTPEQRDAILRDARELARRAERLEIRVACEWHGGTLTDTAPSAQTLFAAVGHPHFGAYWQPRNAQPTAERVSDLVALLPHLMGLHVFHWGADGEKHPLLGGKREWVPCLNRVAAAGTPMYAHLEFVKDEDPAQMREDAAVLKRWIEQANAAAALEMSTTVRNIF
ncbi:MAG: TIM barrel protein [Cytophagales bacterium]|nr:TIM barrel protein [Armatimonadota bacterium]